MNKKIKKVLLITFAVLVTLSAGRLMHPVAAAGSLTIGRGNFNMERNAAFRDGLFQGKLAASHVEEEHWSVGRWNAPADRAAFVAGYRQGYSQQRSSIK
ncbi:MAG: hypothetical protein WCA38_05035 [Candidatus Acidiferrales bacterium]